ncbi:SH3 domain-containing protein 19-like [Mya arenaria]|uniref:SH3 domain-containing protein 19-like n=1 Tax=Mya arenaria TaxID=6604 RepID=UPI0022E1BB15|nr:SH3 domain-containing protein 19-like [Mya arenaria]
MVNIPKNLELELANNNLPKANTARSSENVSSTGENFTAMSLPKPSPRPAARSRPASMMVQPVSKPPPPSLGPSLDDSSVKMKSQGPPSRPAFKPSRPAPHIKQTHDSTEQSTEKSQDAPDRKPFHQRIGVSVMPRPPAPARQQKAEDTDSSEEEEFFNAQEKPDRPPGPNPNRPAPAKPSPPSPKKADKGSPETREVQKRPPRPGDRPSQPPSSPSKGEIASKTKPPRSRAPNVKEARPALPSRPGPGHPLYFHMMQTPHAIALHDYTAQAADELSFMAGDVVLLSLGVDDDWLAGSVDEKEGIFPRAFVKVKMPLSGETLDDEEVSQDSVDLYEDASPEKPDTLGVGPRCRARFDFDGDGPDDLVFEDGDVIRLLERVGPEWLRGELNGKNGLFPLAFVETIEDLPSQGDTKTDSGNMVKAVFDFDGEHGELCFQAGDSVKVTHIVNEEWLFGEKGPHKGQFPVQFVDYVPPGLPPLDPHHNSNQGLPTGEQSLDRIPHSLATWDDEPDKSPSPRQTLSKASNPNPTTAHSDNTTTRITKTPSPQHTGTIQHCVALYDYSAQTPDDLEFSTGDHIEIVEQVGEEWAKGRIGERVGLFPMAFVEIQAGGANSGTISSKTSLHTSPSETEGTPGLALYEFLGEEQNELTFHEGDTVLVQGPVDGAPEWSWGVVDGKRGMFPSAYVQL